MLSVLRETASRGKLITTLNAEVMRELVCSYDADCRLLNTASRKRIREERKIQQIVAIVFVKALFINSVIF